MSRPSFSVLVLSASLALAIGADAAAQRSSSAPHGPVPGGADARHVPPAAPAAPAVRGKLSDAGIAAGPQTLVRVEFVLAEVPVNPKELPNWNLQGKLPQQAVVLASGELTTVSNQQARIQIGRREPRITATNFTQGGQVNSVSFENMGTAFTVISRVTAEGQIVAEIAVEDSRSGPPDEGTTIAAPKQGEPVRIPVAETLNMQSTVTLADGKSVVLGGLTVDGKAPKQRVVLVTGHIVRAP